MSISTPRRQTDVVMKAMRWSAISDCLVVPGIWYSCSYSFAEDFNSTYNYVALNNPVSRINTFHENYSISFFSKSTRYLQCKGNTLICNIMLMFKADTDN